MGNYKVLLSVVQESAGFMNALRNSASQPRRTASKKTSAKSASPTQGKAPATLGKTESPTSEEQTKQGTNDVESNDIKMEDCSDSPPPDAESSGNIEEKRRPKKRKSVSWAPEESLRKVHTFVLDETERTNVHRQSFRDALHSERLRDREVLQSVKMLGSEDVMDETTKWSVPKPLDGVLQLISHGRESKEVGTQAEREQQVLAFLFLSRESLPDSPFEPDPELESHPVSQPKVIPLYEPGDEAATMASTIPPAALLETATTSSSKAVQSLLNTMMNSNSQVTSGNANQEAQPPQVYAKAFDPAIQSQISTENLRQILQSTQGPGVRLMGPSGLPLMGANYPLPARPMAPPMGGQPRHEVPRHFQLQPFGRHGPPHNMPYEARGYQQPQLSPPPFPPQSSPPHRHYGPPQLPGPPGQFSRYPVDTHFRQAPIHGPGYGQNRTEMQEGAWRR
jgi:protein phosphatase 1 regulatory subunit 10